MSDSKVLSYFQHANRSTASASIKSSLSSGSTVSTHSSGSSATTGSSTCTVEELERIKNCGILFDRRLSVNQDMLKEFFSREKCLYNQMTYLNAARIFHCLKADLNENPILKQLKLQAKIESKKANEPDKGTEIPKITYDSSQEKRNTLQLAFSSLKFQKILEDLTYDVEFYGRYPEFKDEESLVSTILFDYMMRKFQLRERLLDEPLDNQNELVTQIETKIHLNKTNLAAKLAKNRISANALTVDDLLPKDLREVDTHKAELPLYCWINPLKANAQELINQLINEEELKLVEYKKSLEKKCFMVDPHCTNLLMFHYSLREKILNHEFVKNFQLIVQDKSSCLSPHTIVKLLTKKDDVIITNVSGGLLAAFVGCMMDEFEGKVYVYGKVDDDKYNELTNKFQQIGCNKYIKLMREEFISSRYDDPKTENAKIILINAPCSKSALMNPMEFLFEEGEDVKFLKDYTLDVNNPDRIKKCIKEEMALFKHAFRFNKVRAIVYQTYSKNSSENETLVKSVIEDFNGNRKPAVFPYKISPPCIPLTAEDIQNEEVVRHLKYLQFKPSSRMNGCFIALLTRDKDVKPDKNSRKTDSAQRIKHQEPATFQEKNGLQPRSKSPKKKIVPGRKRSLSKPQIAYNNLEREIKQLQLQHDWNQKNQRERIIGNENIMIDPVPMDRRSSIKNISQIGKLDPRMMDMTPNRSSTPCKLEREDKQQQQQQHLAIQLKNFQFNH